MRQRLNLGSLYFIRSTWSTTEFSTDKIKSHTCTAKELGLEELGLCLDDLEVFDEAREFERLDERLDVDRFGFG